MLRVALRSRRAAGFAVWQLAALLVGEAAGRETELHGSAFRELAGPPTRQRRKQQAGRRDLADRECTCQGGTPPPERAVPRSAAVALAGQLSPPTNAGAVTAGVGRARMGGSGQRSMKQAQVPDAGERGFGSVKTCP